jgi:hypothetical protein
MWTPERDSRGRNAWLAAIAAMLTAPPSVVGEHFFVRATNSSHIRRQPIPRHRVARRPRDRRPLSHLPLLHSADGQVRRARRHRPFLDRPQQKAPTPQCRSLNPPHRPSNQRDWAMVGQQSTAHGGFGCALERPSGWPMPSRVLHGGGRRGRARGNGDSGCISQRAARPRPRRIAPTRRRLEHAPPPGRMSLAACATPRAPPPSHAPAWGVARNPQTCTWVVGVSA